MCNANEVIIMRVKMLRKSNYHNVLHDDKLYVGVGRDKRP
jgi:hypothetical protein